ncbi:MAG: SH3 domain-containing protein [Lachnospiraceae bacterium]|nr:SH3 domain-containing protein [Lachnospiraceae bacterium]
MKTSEIKEKLITFFKKYGRYILAAVLFIVLVFLMVKCSAKPDGESLNGTEEEAFEPFEVDQVKGMKELITNYYDAYAQGDLEKIQTYATPVTANEQSFIAMFSQYVEKYEDITCYTKPGHEDGAYLVSVSLKMKFEGVDTLAPGLEFFYVRTNEEGNLYIDNLYSSYNRLNAELETDAAIQALINSFQNNSEVLALQAEVQQEYEDAVASDPLLAEMVNTTISDAYNSWAATLQPVSDTEMADTETADTETADTESVADDATEDEQGETSAGQTVYTTATVNVRKEANTDSELLGQVYAGTALTRYEAGDDGWSKIDYNGTEAYIKSEFLSESQPENEEGTVDAGGIEEGTKVLLYNTVNIRSSMSETAPKVGVAYAGEYVTVVMSYQEGWTKVNWNNKTGYIKTELLEQQ